MLNHELYDPKKDGVVLYKWYQSRRGWATENNYVDGDELSSLGGNDRKIVKREKSLGSRHPHG